METVTVKGKVYQIGEPYVIDSDGEIGYLHSYDYDTQNFVCSIKGDLTAIHATPKIIYTIESLGTITDAPIELEDGEWYMCKFKSNEVFVFWTGEFWCDGWGDQIRNDWQGDIVPIYKMVKA